MLSVLTFRTPSEAVAKANNSPFGLSAGHLDREGLADPAGGRRAARRRRVGQHVQQVRPDQPLRWLQGVGLRPRGRPPRSGGLPASERPHRRPQDRQALHRRRLPALRVRALLRGDRRQGQVRRQRVAGLPQGRPGRRRGRPQRLPRLVRPDGVQPRPDRLPGRRDARGPAPDVRRRRRPGRGPHRRARGQGRRRQRRPARLVRRVGRQDHPGRRQREPGGRPVLQPVHPRADRRRRGAGAAGVVAARAGQRASPRRSSPATPWWS